jgi:peptidoglycan hydrolase-like protein with peptidoglycan-binding domain
VDAVGKNRLAFIFALTTFAVAAAAPLPLRAAKSPVAAATPSPSPSPGEPTTQARAAFQALSEPERRALQDALGWLGFYNGVVDGAYGKRTIEALIGYQQSLPATADGVATSKQLGALKIAAAKAKEEVGFKLIDDHATGVRFGAPLKLLDKRESGTAFTSLASADGEIGLYLKETSGDLATLYKTLTAAPNRKVTYKYLKPDAFFVFAGEEGDKKFYRRYAVAPGDAGERKILRGFAFVYPKARAKALDPVALAVANAFDPFPNATPPSPVASATPLPRPTIEPPRLTAVALIVKPGLAVTTLPPEQCKAATIEGGPARFLDGGDTGGLTWLAGAFGEGAAAPVVANGGDDLVALSLALVGETRTALQVASAARAPGGGGQIVAALGPVATGAPLFDRQGRLVAFVAPGEAAKRRADVELAKPHATISAAGIGVSAPPSAAEAPLSVAEISQMMRYAVVGLFCEP